MFLPARNPYDRQTLIEHVSDRARRKGPVQVLLGERRWMVRLARDRSGPPCSSCGSVTPSACCSAAHAGAVYCLDCAFRPEIDSGCARPRSRRRAVP